MTSAPTVSEFGIRKKFEGLGATGVNGHDPLTLTWKKTDWPARTACDAGCTLILGGWIGYGGSMIAEP
jgi:hypothetical protein